MVGGPGIIVLVIVIVVVLATRANIYIKYKLLFRTEKLRQHRSLVLNIRNNHKEVTMKMEWKEPMKETR